MPDERDWNVDVARRDDIGAGTDLEANVAVIADLRIVFVLWASAALCAHSSSKLTTVASGKDRNRSRAATLISFRICPMPVFQSKADEPPKSAFDCTAKSQSGQ